MAFPAPPYTNGQTHTEAGFTFTYNSATGLWVKVAAPAGAGFFQSDASNQVDIQVLDQDYGAGPVTDITSITTRSDGTPIQHGDIVQVIMRVGATDFGRRLYTWQINTDTAAEGWGAYLDSFLAPGAHMILPPKISTNFEVNAISWAPVGAIYFATDLGKYRVLTSTGFQDIGGGGGGGGVIGPATHVDGALAVFDGVNTNKLRAYPVTFPLTGGMTMSGQFTSTNIAATNAVTANVAQFNALAVYGSTQLSGTVNIAYPNALNANGPVNLGSTIFVTGLSTFSGGYTVGRTVYSGSSQNIDIFNCSGVIQVGSSFNSINIALNTTTGVNDAYERYVRVVVKSGIGNAVSFSASVPLTKVGFPAGDFNDGKEHWIDVHAMKTRIVMRYVCVLP